MDREHAGGCTRHPNPQIYPLYPSRWDDGNNRAAAEMTLGSIIQTRNIPFSPRPQAGTSGQLTMAARLNSYSAHSRRRCAYL